MFAWGMQASALWPSVGVGSGVGVGYKTIENNRSTTLPAPILGGPRRIAGAGQSHSTGSRDGD